MKLSVIILNYNTKDLISQCLESIKLQNVDVDGKDLEVFVVDNGSRDGSTETIASKFPFVKLIENKTNLGFAKANNIGIKKAKGKIIALLNSDTLVQENTFVTMTNFLNKNKNIGAATPRLQLVDGSLDLACHRGFPTPFNALSYFFKLEQLLPNFRLFSGYHQTWKDFNKPHEVDAISGASFFIKREVIEKVGNLDERYFMYAEDLDWCMRIKKAGWKIFYNPNATVIHFKKQSGRGKKEGSKISKDIRATRSKAIGHFYETMKIFYEKHYKDKYPKWMRKLVLSGVWLQAKSKLIRNRFL